MNSDNKKNLGQFYTTNYEYILNGFNIPPNVDKIIEPFIGNGDLLKFIGDGYSVEFYHMMK